MCSPQVNFAENVTFADALLNRGLMLFLAEYPVI